MKRIEWLDFGKGITIFFVLLAHVFSGVYATGNYANYNLVTEWSIAVIYTFIMPVFFALSGYLYKPSNNFSLFFRNMKKKAVSLFIPYIIFSIVYVVLQHLSNEVHTLNDWTSLVTIYAKPIGYLWFLYTLFFIFVLVDILSLLKINQLIQLTIYICLFVLSQFLILPYFLKSTFTWVICFYIGVLLKLCLNKLHCLEFLIFILLIVVSLVYQSSLGGNWFETNMLTITNLVSKLLSIPVFFYMFSTIKHGKVFNYFRKYGKYSIIIYLVHAPAASVFRALLLRFNIFDYFALLISCTLLTWFFCIFICYLSKKNSLIEMIFYPFKYIKRKLLT